MTLATLLNFGESGKKKRKITSREVVLKAMDDHVTSLLVTFGSKKEQHDAVINIG